MDDHAVYRSSPVDPVDDRPGCGNRLDVDALETCFERPETVGFDGIAGEK